MNEKCSVSDQDNRLNCFSPRQNEKTFYFALSPRLPGRGGRGEGLRVLDLTQEHKLNWA